MRKWISHGAGDVLRESLIWNVSGRFVEMICKENADCAVITHGFFMHTLIKEMKRAGFKTNHSSVKYKNGEYVTAEKQ